MGGGCADIARAGELVSGASNIPPQLASVAFAAGFGTLCYGLAPGVMDKLNTVLVIGVVITFAVSNTHTPLRHPPLPLQSRSLDLPQITTFTVSNNLTPTSPPTVLVPRAELEVQVQVAACRPLDVERQQAGSSSLSAFCSPNSI
jgi:hypothetical protein